MNAKHEEIRSPSLYYCFVDLGARLTDAPQLFIVPSEVIADAVKSSHHQWLTTPGKNGRVRSDSPLRRLLPDYSHIVGDSESQYARGWLNQYEGAWHLLGTTA